MWFVQFAAPTTDYMVFLPEHSQSWGMQQKCFVFISHFFKYNILKRHVTEDQDSVKLVMFPLFFRINLIGNYPLKKNAKGMAIEFRA